MANGVIDLERLKQEDGSWKVDIEAGDVAEEYYRKNHQITDRKLIRFFPFEKHMGMDLYRGTLIITTFEGGRTICDIGYSIGPTGVGFLQNEIDLVWPVLVEKYPELAEITELYGNFTPKGPSWEEFSQWTYKIPQPQ